MLLGCKDNWSYTSRVTWSMILSKFANLLHIFISKRILHKGDWFYSRLQTNYLGLEISENFDLEQINLNKLLNKIQGMTSQIQTVNGRMH